MMRAFVWQNGTVRRIASRRSEALDLNGSDQIVGWSKLKRTHSSDAEQPLHAVLWTRR